MRRRTAFTLAELLIVVVILGILAAAVLPKFSNATQTARASMLADDLRIMRQQVMVFQGQHRGIAPGYPALDSTKPADADVFAKHMTLASNLAGSTAEPGTAGFDFGPYLREMPVNPINGKVTVQIVGDAANMPAAADDSHGWIYQASTLQIKADAAGTDVDGKAYIDY